MASRNVVLQMQLEEVLTDLMVKTGADNVIVDAAKNENLTTRLASIMAAIKTATDDKITATQVDTKISTAINALIDGAPETYDTLKEIAEYISSDKTAMDALNAAIGGKVDKVAGKGLSANDFTDVLKTKLEGIATGATKVEKSATNGSIKMNGAETTVYTHPTGAGNIHLPTGGTAGQVLRAAGSGAGAWGENVRSGATTPTDLAAGELFIKLL